MTDTTINLRTALLTVAIQEYNIGLLSIKRIYLSIQRPPSSLKQALRR